jgi:hypothetical protein
VKHGKPNRLGQLTIKRFSHGWVIAKERTTRWYDLIIAPAQLQSKIIPTRAKTLSAKIRSRGRHFRSVD